MLKKKKKRWQARFGLWATVCQPCTKLYRRKGKKQTGNKGDSSKTSGKNRIIDGNTAVVPRRECSSCKIY